MSDQYAQFSKLQIDTPAPRVLRITFNRPEALNAIDAETHKQLTYIWRTIDEDRDINAVILTGAGKAFSAGGDLRMAQKMLTDHETRMTEWKHAKDLVYNIINCSKPIVSAINGVAVGAGWWPASWPTFRSRAGRAHHRRPHAARRRRRRRGCDHLAAALRHGQGQVLSADLPPYQRRRSRAHRPRLAVRRRRRSCRRPRSAVATELATGAQSAIRWTKYALNNWLRMAGPTFDASTALEMMGFATPDAVEGVTSHLEKRKAEIPRQLPTVSAGDGITMLEDMPRSALPIYRNAIDWTWFDRQFRRRTCLRARSSNGRMSASARCRTSAFWR